MANLYILFVLVIVLPSIRCNIWDNILSEAESTSPIIPTNSFNFDFNIAQYNSKGNIDFNEKLQILTIIVYKDAILLNIQFFRMEFHLQTLTAYTQQFLIGCQNLKLAFLPSEAQNKLSGLTRTQNKISKQNLFLVNILFKFIGFHQEGNIFRSKKLNMYQFQYDLTPQTQNLIQSEANVDDQLDLKDKLNKLNFVLLVDDKGQINKVYSDKRLTEQLKLSDSSRLKQQSKCEADVKQVTVQDLKSLLVAGFKNRQMLVDNLQDLSGN